MGPETQDACNLLVSSVIMIYDFFLNPHGSMSEHMCVQYLYIESCLCAELRDGRRLRKWRCWMDSRLHFNMTVATERLSGDHM